MIVTKVVHMNTFAAIYIRYNATVIIVSCNKSTFNGDFYIYIHIYTSVWVFVLFAGDSVNKTQSWIFLQITALVCVSLGFSTNLSLLLIMRSISLLVCSVLLLLSSVDL